MDKFSNLGRPGLIRILVCKQCVCHSQLTSLTGNQSYPCFNLIKVHFLAHGAGGALFYTLIQEPGAQAPPILWLRPLLDDFREQLGKERVASRVRGFMG